MTRLRLQLRIGYNMAANGSHKCKYGYDMLVLQMHQKIVRCLQIIFNWKRDAWMG